MPKSAFSRSNENHVDWSHHPRGLERSGTRACNTVAFVSPGARYGQYLKNPGYENPRYSREGTYARMGDEGNRRFFVSFSQKSVTALEAVAGWKGRVSRNAWGQPQPSQ